MRRTVLALAVILGVVIPAVPAHAELDSTCTTTYTYTAATGDIAVRARKVWDGTPVYKFRFVMADAAGHTHFDDYPVSDIGHFTSSYTRNISTLRGGSLWAILAFHYGGACGGGVMFTS